MNKAIFLNIFFLFFYSCKEKTTSNTTFYKSSNSAFNYQGRTEIIKDSCKVLQNGRAKPARIQGGFRSLDGKGIIYSAVGSAPQSLKGLKVT